MIATLTPLGLLAELRLGILGEEFGEGLAILIGMNLRAEDVMQVLVLEHRRRHRRRDPENFLLRLDFGGERHRVGAGINAVDDLDLLLAEQALHLIDRDVRLALQVGVDRHDLVLAGDAAALVDEIDRDLAADRAGDRAAGGERAGQVIDDADPDVLGLGSGERPPRLNVAAVAAEFFSSDLREVAMACSSLASGSVAGSIVMRLAVFGDRTGKSTRVDGSASDFTSCEGNYPTPPERAP